MSAPRDLTTLLPSLLLVGALGGGVLACSGTIDGGHDRPDGSGTGASSGSGGVGGSSGSAGNGGKPPVVSGVTLTTRVARLTHEQYRNTVDDLFGITDDPTTGFAPDALNGFDFDTSLDFRVDARLGPQYRSAAEALAARAASDTAIFARLVPCDAASAACADQFIASFGQRAFRRPLTSAEATRFRSLFERGPELVASGDAFHDGLRLVVEAVLQAPQFLYRTELADQVGGDGLVTLDAWELAARLSYALWNSMPDDALFRAASDGSLASVDAVRTQAERLLGDARATRKAVSFHGQAWQFSRYSRITPDTATYPLAPMDIATRVRDASERFVQEVVTANGGLSELLTAPYAYADPELAPLYGKSVTGGLTRVDFPAGERQGLLMQVGYLASNAYSIKTDPIHRGLFVLRSLLCRSIPDPPPGAAQTPPPATNTPPKTTREEVSLLTGQPNCRGCHAEINAPGFAFEAFDAVGQARTTENGVAVDTTGELDLDGTMVNFRNANELVQALATSDEAQRCYAGRWLEFVLGRRLAAEDAAVEASIGEQRLGARSLVAALTTIPAFMKRAPNEVGP